MEMTARAGRRRLSVLVAAVATAGCASVHVDDAGRTHVVGLVWLTLPAPDPNTTTAKAADVVRARTVGITVQRTPESGALVLGYSDATLATIYNNSHVRLPVEQPAAKRVD